MKRFNILFSLPLLVLGMLEASSVELGEKLYNGAGGCFACHQKSGKGLLGAVPPLAKSAWVTDDKKRLIAITIKGLEGPIKVNGMSYFASMPPQLQFNDEQMAHILTYIRSAWGNKASEVTKAEVTEVRELIKNDKAHVDQLLKRFPFHGKMARANGKGKLDNKEEYFDEKRTTVVRTFMPGASPAAFAVALPEGPYYCWDAGECRLRYVWKEGGFITERKKHWASNGKPVVTFRGVPYYVARSSKFSSEDFNEQNLTNQHSPVYDTASVNDCPIKMNIDKKARPKYKGYRLLGGFQNFATRLELIRFEKKLNRFPKAKALSVTLKLKVQSLNYIFN